MKLDKKILYILAISFLFVFVYFNLNYTKAYDYSCVAETTTATLSGISLEPLVNDTDNIIFYRGFYECNEIERNDLVVYRINDYTDYIVKIVKGVPGDSFYLEQEGNDSWRIFVNSVPLRNSQGEMYKLSNEGKQMLLLYQHHYNKAIPDEYYIILGDDTRGTLDSSRFGLAERDKIIGKVVSVK